MDLALASFVLESRRKDGQCYPPNTLKNILAAIHRVMKERHGAKNVISFMDSDKREKCYPQLNNAMDHKFLLLRVNGIGIERKISV